jgi:hypothetical protein
LRPACGADAVEDDLVPLEVEATGYQTADTAGTRFDLEDAVTGPTVEVVVVALAGYLVTGGGTRQLDGAEPAVVEQRLDRAVDRRDSEAGQRGPRCSEDLVGGERAAGGGEGRADGVALTGLALHGGAIVELSAAEIMISHSC